jgi:hypothetical protein
MRTGSSVAVRPPEAVRVGRGGHVANSNRGNGAMDLRRRGKNRVVEAMARIVALLPIGEEPARPNCDVDVDRVVPEGFNESIEPRLQRVSPFRTK